MNGTKKQQQPEITPEEAVVAALNEHGYLLHHKVIDVLATHATAKRPKHSWHVEASEVPVSLPNGAETRIDIVLHHGTNEHRPWRAVIECKRSSPDYKRWVFFGQTSWTSGPSPDRYYFHKTDLLGGWRQNTQPDPPLFHHVETCPSVQDCPVFDYGVEAKLNRRGSNNRSSATDAIEDAFNQITLGLAGLALRQSAAHQLTFRILPVVVTTAELMSVQFQTSKVTIEGGTLQPKDIKLEPRRWLAVNHRLRDVVSRHSGVEPTRSIDIAASLASRQVRTVFVVQPIYLHEFLAWLEHCFKCSAG